MRSTLALSFIALAGFAAAQETPQNDYPYTINPDDVSGSDRQTWCDNQRAQCPLICLQQPGVTTMTTIQNDCDPDALTYACVCENNVAPNITLYSQTLPFYICQEWGNQCERNCGNNNVCASACRQDHPCGAQEVQRPNTTARSTTLSATASQTEKASIPVTGFGGATATGSNNGNGQGAASATLNLGQSYGLAILFAGVFAGFALIL